MSNVRGVIRNRRYSNQVKDYSKLRWGKITPTDIDGFIDFGNKCFVIIELKHVGGIVPRGQLVALERAADSHRASGKSVLCVVASYNTNGDIDASTCAVESYRSNGEWRKIKNHPVTLRGIIDQFLAKYAPEFLEFQ